MKNTRSAKHEFKVFNIVKNKELYIINEIEESIKF
jgi:hypothetical protein